MIFLELKYRDTRFTTLIDTNTTMSSIVIQKQIISDVRAFICILQKKNAQLEWSEFIEKSMGDDENILAYLKMLNAIQTMDTPSDLAVQFNMIRGQFANSEDKFIDQLIESGHEEGDDYQKLTVVNERLEEDVLFLSYHCLKTFVLDKDDKKMLRALLIGEEVYRMYKIYSTPFAKKTSLKTHWMAVEQLEESSETPSAVSNCIDALNNPKIILRFITGNQKTMAKQILDMEMNPENWGKIIVPATEAVYVNALDDVKRLVTILKESMFDDYKASVKAKLKSAKEKTTGIKWEFRILTSCIAIDPNCTQLSHDDVITRVKEFWLGTLAQKHTPLKNRSHEEYLELVAELEAARAKRFGYFNALKYNAIQQNKVLAEIKRLTKEREQTKKVTNKKETTVEPKITHGYTTGGSDVEDESKEESVAEEAEEEPKPEPKAKPAKKKSAEKKTTRKKSTPKKTKVVEVSEEEIEDISADDFEDDE